RRTRTGRPCGGEEFVRKPPSLLGRPLLSANRGRKPGARAKEQKWLLRPLFPQSFPIQPDVHYLRVCRYVERNALRAGLVRRAEEWRWGSLWRRCGAAEQRALLHAGPVRFPSDWVELVNQPLTQEELDALRLCVNRGRPYGGPTWTKRTAAELGLGATLRQRGRPRKETSLARKARKGS
ncbi:MAG TPA: hypothetical protein VFJ30_10560, partial [Phycisphaerae bacterium]|nr:hypothetical protein [Phycisphaerae bacterium]